MYHHHGHPHFFIRSKFDGKVLTVEGHHPDSPVIVHHREHPASPKQLWRFDMLGEHFLIVSALDPNLVLEVTHDNHAVVRHRHHPPGVNQMFEWHGGHLIRSHIGANLVLEIKHHSNSDYAKVDINHNHGGESQRWEVDRTQY